MRDPNLHTSAVTSRAHPFLRHPHTGAPLQAVGLVGGKPVWPVMGGSPDDPPNDPPKDPPKDGPKDPPKDPAADPPKELGFPPNTPVAEMTAEQQAAYWRHQARSHEDRNKQWQRTLGGKTIEQAAADQVELEKLRNDKRTDAEKAVEDAKKATRDEVRREFTPKLVEMAFNAALGHVEEQDRKDLIDNLDMTKFVNDNGDVDTAKVSQVASKIAPAAKGAGGTRDYGAGRRESGSGAPDVSGTRSRMERALGRRPKEQ